MPVIFTPASGATIIDALESDIDEEASVSVSIELPDIYLVEEITWTTDLPEDAVITADLDSITVSIASFAALFPVLGIDYLLAGVQGTCYSWGTLPEAAEEVCAYRKDNNNIKTFSLNVTVHLDDDTTETASYTIRVEANYNTGRDALIAAVDARR